MSGGGGGAGSLGQRSLSHGSLSTKDVLVSIHANNVGLVLRKSIKGNIGKKERFLARVFKSAFRRRVRMFALLAAAITFCVLVFSNGRKEEVEHGSTDMDCRSTSCLQSQRLSSSIFSRYPKLLSTKEQDKKKVNTPSLPGSVAVRGENRNWHSSNLAVGNSLPPGHPCENFSIPPPPADKKRTGPRPCPVCYLPVEEAILQMPHVSSLSPVLRNLTYVQEKTLNLTGWFGGSVFGGHPSLKQRSDSFDIKESMNVHCGFVRGDKPGMQSGFDIDNSDLVEMEQCQGVVVASAIFGNFDVIQQPKNISEIAKRSVCFFMFIDEETEADWRNSSILDDRMRVGLWRTVVVHNLPYVDPRRNGKVPKLLLHRLFPNARYSIWIDGKLELVVDPYQILERFLWRKNATFAISRHYKRFDVFDEALANKVAGKYDNASIDFQVEFYKREGLTPYSEAKLPITSDVPEGCVIIKEHIPITNLFTCLWFNEVDRFTPRDQISFSTVRDNIMSKVNWSMNMFMDCARRNFVVQKYHRDLLIKMSPPVGNKTHHPPPHKPPKKSSAEAATDPFLRLWKKSNGRARKSGLQQHQNQDITKRKV